MPGTTTRLSLPYPVAADTVDVPRDVRALADALAPITTSFLQGTLAARPAGGTTGRLYYATDTDELFYDDGTVFNPITPGESSAGSGGQLLVGDVGMTGQVRAGRELTVTDFTDLGLTQPVGLFNLSNLTNLGSGGALVNKGAVPFGAGINGAASTAAVFAGATTQALYVEGVPSDVFNIRTGSWGCWFRTAKRGVFQSLVTKRLNASNMLYGVAVQSTSNTVFAYMTPDAVTVTSATGVSDVADDRWHFAVVIADGTAMRVYVDGVLEASVSAPMVGALTYPLNIGGYGATSAAAAVEPHYGRVDEAFITHDVLTEDQIRNLYCARLPHSLPSAPTRANVNVHRRRRGGTLATTDFPTQPLRLYNFTGGALTDQGSNNVGLNVNGAPAMVAGVDGTPNGAYHFALSPWFSATDAGLPATTASRSYGAWFKTTTATGTLHIMAWGLTPGTNDTRLAVTTGILYAYNGADAAVAGFVADGQWHFAAVVEDNAAGDGVKRKLYLDGRLVVGSTVLASVTLGGANRFTVGANSGGAGGSPFTGQIDGAFVCGYALTFEQQAALYAKGTQDLGPSPKNEGDHIEALRTSDVLATFDTLSSADLVDVGVVS